MPNREYSKCLTAGYLSAPEASRTPTARHLLYYAIYAPINIRPHYPPYGTQVGIGGDYSQFAREL